MKYKMICIDMDGTLLGKKHSISDNNKQILKRAYEKGAQIVVTTGRLYNNAAYFSELIGVPSPVIAGNGAVIREKRSNDVIYRSKISNEVCLELFKLGKKHKVIVHFHTVDKIVTNNYLSAFIAKRVLPCKDMADFPIKIETITKSDDFEKWLIKNNGVITKCIAFRTTKSRLKGFIKDARKISGITTYLSGDTSVEINEAGVSKGMAVKLLGEHLGIKREEIICIGDNENDISMIKYAGLGIAMGNGIQKLKDIAQYVTDTNLNDGVGKAVEKFVLMGDE